MELRQESNLLPQATCGSIKIKDAGSLFLSGERRMDCSLCHATRDMGTTLKYTFICLVGTAMEREQILYDCSIRDESDVDVPR